MRKAVGCVLTLTLVMLCANLVAASSGDRPYPVSGTVGALTTTGGALSSFILNVPAHGKTAATALTVSVTSTTTYRIAGFSASSTVVVTGAQAAVILSAAPTAGAGTASEVDIVPPAGATVTGTIEEPISIDPTTGDGSFALEARLSRSSATVTLTINVTGTTLYYAGNKPKDSSVVVVGGIATVVLSAALSGTSGTALVVSVVPPPNTVLCGTIGTVTSDATSGALDSFTLQVPAHGKDAAETVTVNVTSDTKYYLGDKADDSSVVTLGAQADVLIQGALSGSPGALSGTALLVDIIPPPKAVLCGTVQDILTDSGGNLTSFDLAVPAHGKTAAETVTIDVTSSTKYYNGCKTADSTVVTVGAKAQVLLTGPLSGTTGTAAIVDVIPPPNAVVCGTVQSVSITGGVGSFTLSAKVGKKATATLTINVNSSTKYYLGHKAADSTAVTVGAKAEVLVNGQLSDNTGTALVVCIQPSK